MPESLEQAYAYSPIVDPDTVHVDLPFLTRSVLEHLAFFERFPILLPFGACGVVIADLFHLLPTVALDDDQEC